MTMTSRAHVMISLFVLALTALAQPRSLRTLYSFTGGSGGGNPQSSVIQDRDGNLYGTAYIGGDPQCGFYGCGVVYKVDTAGKEIPLHSFTGGSDGAFPNAPLVRDKAGNIYGTTGSGGSVNEGTVFKIDASGKEAVLYSFTGGSDGCEPQQGLVLGESGALFGTTSGCGSSGFGTIFKLDSASKFTLLHTFTGGLSDGGSPAYGHLTIDSTANLYGVTPTGGTSGEGVLYKLSKSRTFTVLHSYAGGTSDGCKPYGSVIQDTDGNLYGTTWGCGSDNFGTIWQTSKTGEETILHSFAGSPSDGGNPVAGVARDSRGNLYGITMVGGPSDLGAVYELSAKRKLILLHSFHNSDGANPSGEILRTTNGTLFGTTEFDGGNLSEGTVWKYLP
jgi:uncharacterized repeat protein (TIGR03803 family)